MFYLLHLISTLPFLTSVMLTKISSPSTISLLNLTLGDYNGTGYAINKAFVRHNAVSSTIENHVSHQSLGRELLNFSLHRYYN